MADPHSELRETNGRIAEDYDRVPYDPVPVPAIDAERVLGLAALYGAGPRGATFDVLDLGCGTGVQLTRVAAHNGGGRLIGTDLSQSVVARATARCADYGTRARITCADFLDLTAKDLGQFDLIYLVGVLYITPPEVQRHLLNLVAACLKPGGVAVISYYYGFHALLAAGLRDTLRLAVNRDESPSEQVQAARAMLRTMGHTLVQVAGNQHPMLAVLQNADARDESIFYHELLGTHFHPLSTAGLESELGAHGVHFLHQIGGGPQGRPVTARERALMADTIDYASGGYRYAVFAKTDAARGPDLKSDVLWESRLVREGAKAPAVFHDPASGMSINAGSISEPALDLLAKQPLPWSAFAATATKNTAALNAPAGGQLQTLEDEFLLLWQYGLVSPLWRSPT